MTRADLIHHPEAIAAREALRRECAADLAVWTAANGSAMRIPFPRPRNHAEEIANARAEEDARHAPDT